MEQLNVCVIGAGDLGTVHTGQWQKLPGAEVLAICDIDETRALAAQEKFGIDAIYTDYREAFDHPGIDAVSVAIPSGVHRIVSEAAMRRGYHVLCEKPIAVTLEDGQAMVTAAQECGVKFALGFCKRFLEQVHKLCELVQGGAIGRPVFYRHASGIQVRPKLWIMDKEMGGGPIIDMACHYFDQWRLIFDSEPVRVKASGLTLSAESPLMTEYDPEVDTVTILVELGYLIVLRDALDLQVVLGDPEGLPQRDELVLLEGEVNVLDVLIAGDECEVGVLERVEEVVGEQSIPAGVGVGVVLRGSGTDDDDIVPGHIEDARAAVAGLDDEGDPLGTSVVPDGREVLHEPVVREEIVVLRGVVDLHHSGQSMGHDVDEEEVVRSHPVPQLVEGIPDLL